MPMSWFSNQSYSIIILHIIKDFHVTANEYMINTIETSVMAFTFLKKNRTIIYQGL
jgi:hypothetical protein